MTRRVFETNLRLSAKLAGVERAQPVQPGKPSPELEKALLAERAREVAKERQAIERVLQNLMDAAAGLRSRQQEYLAEMQRLSIELAVAIASRLLHDQIEAGDFPVENIVRKVVERLDTPQPVTVFLHPEDLALLQQRLGEGQAIFPENSDVQMAGDTTLTRGDVRAQSGDISVLADLEGQIAEIRRSLQETLPVAGTDAESAPAIRRFEEKRQSA